MKIPRDRRSAKRRWAFLLVVCLLAPASIAQGAPAFVALHWQARYVGGTETIPGNARWRVAFEGEHLVCASGENVALSIPLAAIRDVSSFNNRDRHPLAAGFRTAGKFPAAIVRNSSGGDGQAAAGILTLYMVYGFVPTWAVASIVHRHRERYVVNIAWDDDGTARQVALEMRPADYESFLPELQRATGHEWLNLAERRKRVLEARSSATSARLPSKGNVAAFKLKPGPYQLLLLETGPAEGELYFIQGNKVDTRRIAAVVPVEILPGTGLPGQNPFVFGRGEHLFTILEVRLVGKTLRPKAPEPQSGGAR